MKNGGGKSLIYKHIDVLIEDLYVLIVFLGVINNGYSEYCCIFACGNRCWMLNVGSWMLDVRGNGAVNTIGIAKGYRRDSESTIDINSKNRPNKN